MVGSQLLTAVHAGHALHSECAQCEISDPPMPRVHQNAQPEAGELGATLNRASASNGVGMLIRDRGASAGARDYRMHATVTAPGLRTGPDHLYLSR